MVKQRGELRVELRFYCNERAKSNGLAHWVKSLSKMLPPFGGFANAIATVIYKPPDTMHLDRVGRVFFPRSQRRKIERLARREPASVGRHATHWSFRSLAEATIEQG
jgi:hypothetical protein